MEEYVESEYLVEYILDNYKDRYVNQECQGVIFSNAISKFDKLEIAEKVESMNPRMRETFRDLIDRIVTIGSVQYKNSIVQRIIAENDDVIINRCPNCSKIVRTSKAKQCRWCLSEWRESV